MLRLIARSLPRLAARPPRIPSARAAGAATASRSTRVGAAWRGAAACPGVRGFASGAAAPQTARGAAGDAAVRAVLEEERFEPTYKHALEMFMDAEVTPSWLPLRTAGDGWEVPEAAGGDDALLHWLEAQDGDGVLRVLCASPMPERVVRYAELHMERRVLLLHQFDRAAPHYRPSHAEGFHLVDGSWSHGAGDRRYYMHPEPLGAEEQPPPGTDNTPLHLKPLTVYRGFDVSPSWLHAMKAVRWPRSCPVPDGVRVFHYEFFADSPVVEALQDRYARLNTAERPQRRRADEDERAGPLGPVGEPQLHEPKSALKPVVPGAQVLGDRYWAEHGQSGTGLEGPPPDELQLEDEEGDDPPSAAEQARHMREDHAMAVELAGVDEPDGRREALERGAGTRFVNQLMDPLKEAAIEAGERGDVEEMRRLIEEARKKDGVPPQEELLRELDELNPPELAEGADKWVRRELEPYLEEAAREEAQAGGADEAEAAGGEEDSSEDERRYMAEPPAELRNRRDAEMWAETQPADVQGEALEEAVRGIDEREVAEMVRSQERGEEAAALWQARRAAVAGEGAEADAAVMEVMRAVGCRATAANYEHVRAALGEVPSGGAEQAVAAAARRLLGGVRDEPDRSE